MHIIGCGGQHTSGKDELSNHLASQLNENSKCGVTWRRTAFANAVKKIFTDSFNVSLDFIEEWKRKPNPPEGFSKNIRQALQFIGDGFRQIKSDIWIETAFRESFPKIISDIRYLNEAAKIRELGGLNILLWRKGFENSDTNQSEAQIKPTVDWFIKSGLEGYVGDKDLPLVASLYPNLPAEAKPGLFHFFIRNDGTLGQLFEKVDKLIVPVVKEKFKI